VALLAGWLKTFVVGVLDDAGAVGCPKRLPPAPEVPKLKDILSEVRSLSSSRMAIHQELLRN
jgi:hypothetical protein